jgi:hypothetical protein
MLNEIAAKNCDLVYCQLLLTIPYVNRMEPQKLIPTTVIFKGHCRAIITNYLIM